MQKDQKNILSLYVGIFISIILNFVPVYSVQVFGFVFFFASLISCYIYRSRSKENSLQHSHAVYLIKTIWIFSLFLFIGIIAAGLLADNSSIHAIIDQASNGIMPNERAMEEVLINYMKNNMLVFMVTIGSSFIYAFYRLYKGMLLVKNNNIISNTKSWF